MGMCISTPPTYTPMAGGTRLTVSGRRPIFSMFGAKTRFVIEGASPAPSARSPRWLPPPPPLPQSPQRASVHCIAARLVPAQPQRRLLAAGEEGRGPHGVGISRRLLPEAEGRGPGVTLPAHLSPPFPPQRISGVADSPVALGFPTIRPGWRAVHHFGHRGVRGVLHARREGRDNG